jgi:dTDP-4-amino-4,6-dideoxygalactose transaminase
MLEENIPFNRASFDRGELDRVRDALENGHISGDGPFSRQAENILSKMHDGARVLLTPSCSHALELAASLVGFEPGDEIIVPSFTFVTSVSSFVAHGATPVFCDIDPITLGLDLQQAKELVTPKTKAIVLVHYGGVPADPEGFAQLAEEHNLVLIEDNAHGLGGRSNGKALGTFGAMSTLSFHETKNITCGEGGALVINDPRYIQRAEIIREKGTDRSRFFRGQVDKYTWQALGSSWVLSDILSAVLVAQLRHFDEIQASRLHLWAHYINSLGDWATKNRFSLGGGNSGTAHLFYVLAPDHQTQLDFLDHMKSRRIGAVFHYQPLHTSPMGRKLRQDDRALPVTEQIAPRLVRLPLYRGLSDREMEEVLTAAGSFSSPQ